MFLGKSILFTLLAAVTTLFLSFAACLYLLFNNEPLSLTSLVAISSVFVLLLVLTFYYLLSPLNQAIDAVKNGISAFKDNDFSLTIHNNHYRETDGLLKIYNDLSDTLRNERNAINQQQLMLDKIIQRTPIALFLIQSNGIIVYSNQSAKDLLKLSKPLSGENFEQLKTRLPDALLTATEQHNSGIITVQLEQQIAMFNVECSEFTLQGKPHLLYSYHDISTPMSLMERDMWKQAIRLISHELNNSLAPISSLTRSAQKIIEQPEHNHLLSEVLHTIGNRAQHLHEFIDQYATLTRLPKPQIEGVKLATFIHQIETLTEVKCQLDVIRDSANFDPRQLEQVIINLIKNAKESGSAPNDVMFSIEQQANVMTFRVDDRGCGLTEQQRQQVLLPFFTTKQSGSGVGLALCNEIVSNHNGQLALVNRDGGGLSVSFQLMLDK